MSSQQSLIDINIAALQEGLHVLGLLNTEQYKQGYKPAFQSAIGTHFRHILEHYRCFLVQIDDHLFRYDKRARDQRLETDLNYAQETVYEVIESLKQFDMSLFTDQYEIGELQVDGDLTEYLIGGVNTTLERELMFLQSHSMHHYAMIAAMTRALGLQPNADFGVAIPTRNYARCLDQENKTSATSVKSICAR